MRSASFIVGEDHPYWKFADPHMVLSAHGMWRVIWRDFFSTRQDQEFHTEIEAKEYLGIIKKLQQPPLQIDLREYCAEDIEAADRFWRDIPQSITVVATGEIPKPIQRLMIDAKPGIRDKIKDAFDRSSGDSPIERVFATAIWCACRATGRPFLNLSAKDGKMGPAPHMDAASICLGAQIWVFDWPVDFVVWAHDGERWRRALIECDGHQFHSSTKEQAARDRSRDRQAQLADIPMLRFTGTEIWADPGGCADAITRWAAGLHKNVGVA